MPGMIGKAALAASTYTSVATVTTEKTLNIRVVNRDLINPAAIRLAICPSGYVAPTAPANADHIEPIDIILAAGEVIEETGIAVSAGEVVVAYSSTDTVTVRVHGH